MRLQRCKRRAPDQESLNIPLCLTELLLEPNPFLGLFTLFFFQIKKKNWGGRHILRHVGSSLTKDSSPALRAQSLTQWTSRQALWSIYFRKSVIPNPSFTPLKCKKPTASFTSLVCCLCQGLENHLFEM